MKRREFLGVLGSVSTAWPLAALAQQPTRPVVGFLRNTLPEEAAHLVAAFRKGMSETGYVEGRNVLVEYRWTGGQTDRLPSMAADLVNRQVDVIVALGSTPAVRAASAATTATPTTPTASSSPGTEGRERRASRPLGACGRASRRPQRDGAFDPAAGQG